MYRMVTSGWQGANRISGDTAGSWVPNLHFVKEMLRRGATVGWYDSILVVYLGRHGIFHPAFSSSFFFLRD